MDKVIFHIDVNSAFLSWEAVYRIENGLDDGPDLREIPSAIAGDRDKRHGVIFAKSIPAKNQGVLTGEPSVSALKKCPDLKLVPPNHDLYIKCSQAFMKTLEDFTPTVEKYSIDEAFCDMTGTQVLFGPPLEAANKIRERIKNELKFTVNIGISSNKLLAKMASDFKKPDMIHTLFPEEIEEKMWVLPVGELFSVGKATVKKLEALGIHTIGQLAQTDVSILKSHFKKHGELIHAFANGRDESIVSTESVQNKGYGNSTTISFDVEDEGTAKMVLLSLSETLGARLRQDNMLASVVAVSIVDKDFVSKSHQRTLLTPTNSTDGIHKIVCALFDEVWDYKPIRNLGIQTSKLVEGDAEMQLNLFQYKTDEKREKLDKAIDKIRDRYGDDAIQRASLVRKDDNK